MSPERRELDAKVCRKLGIGPRWWVGYRSGPALSEGSSDRSPRRLI